MHILVFSDSHGKRSNIEEAVRRQIEKPAAIIFLGDGLRDMIYAEIGDIPLYCVKGNCDFGLLADDIQSEQTIYLGGKRIFITHGHHYGVKSTLTPLMCEAAEREADIVLFGHTHEACEGTVGIENSLGLKIEKPICIMNPGSIGAYPYRFGVITIDREGRILLSHGSIE